METKKNSADKGQFRGASSEAVGAAQAKEAGPQFDWHYGRVTRMGNFEVAGGREIVIVWEEGGVTCQQGNITDDQWEIFKLAFSTSGRIAVLSDLPRESWMYDYRFLEAVR
ncbi:MAG: hypothetical protein J2P31_04315 [Blastocatellia bacterium]|nr:hypothetical protein [Blastocatellia bacterium]